MEGNIRCVYAFYGLNALRCSRQGNEGNYCQYWKNCRYFIKGGDYICSL